jgi:glucuronate isomerase
MENKQLPPERYFSSEPNVRGLAMEIYEDTRSLPILSPHNHVDAQLFVDPWQRFGNPTELFIRPDHYVFRMLYSQGIPLEGLGIRPFGSKEEETEVDPQQAWKLFCANYYLFTGTPTSLWMREALAGVFGIVETPSEENADRLYQQLNGMLQTEEYSPRSLYKRFGIEALCTTNAATELLEAHQSLRDQDWMGRVLPTFRPDKLTKLENPDWKAEVELLGMVTNQEIGSYRVFVQALEKRRQFFKQMGAKATDHDVLMPYTDRFCDAEMDTIFQRALKGRSGPEDASKFSAQMLMEMARMSVEDGLVMQIHTGSFRNHNQGLFDRFGPDMGSDIPVRMEFTRNLAALLQEFGNSRNFSLVLFTLDESCYSRELAPLAGHYPAVKLGPPWWFFDSLAGMQRYLDAVVETAGFYNLAGFTDDTRGFCSIPARHDLWRRATANWLASQTARQVISLEDARLIAQELAYGLAKRTYHL